VEPANEKNAVAEAAKEFLPPARRNRIVVTLVDRDQPKKEARSKPGLRS
jgi:hypothetical protein